MRPAVPAVLLLGLAPALAGAQGVVIDHKKVDCIVVGKHPRMNACFKPNGNGGKRKVFFRPEGVDKWFYVEMKSNVPCHEGVLPRPKKELVDKRVFYYLALEGAESGQTQEYDPVVVRSAQECKRDLVAPIVPNPGPVVVFPSLPAGFAVSAAALTTPVVVGAVAVVGAGAATTVALTRDGDDNPTAGTTQPGAPVTTQPSATTTTTTTTTTTLPPSRTPLDLACNADPRSGDAPLRVSFRAFPTGGIGDYAYLWNFGDGTTSNQVSPGHTYTAPGGYLASVQVTSGGDTARCERSITVTTPPTPPPPPPPPTGPFTLTVTLAGAGTGSVASAPPGIACAPDCTEAYPNGTVVTLTATPAGGSTFAGWTGAGCSGTGTCVVTMNAAQAVTATFTPPTLLLTVVLAGTGTGTVTSAPAGINCAPDCTEPYASGTLVTLTATPTGGSTFGGWSGGGCSGVGPCTVTMNAAQTVTATFNPPFLLTVVLAGTGTGTVTSAPAGINCAPDCTEPYAGGTLVSLTATPTGGSTFGGWSGGGCSGVGPCTVTMNAAQTVTALFNPSGCTATLNVTLSGTGLGSVSSFPPGINCIGTDCTEAYACGTNVVLTASPQPLSAFGGWSGGGCSGTGTCSLVMNVDTTVDAQFNAAAFNLHLQITGQFGGGGRVTSLPAGIDCSEPPLPGDVCVAPFPPATVVRMTAVPGPGSTPVQWSGDCTGTPQGQPCSVTMDQERFTNALFVLGFAGSRPGAAPLRWTSQIEARDAAGQVFLNGGHAGSQRTGRAEQAATARAEANHMEAILTEARGPGLWRFEFPQGEPVEPGSLTPLQGEVVSVTAQSITFRLKGQAGERVAFSFRRRE
jgi:PKD repeat protein